VRPSVRGRGTDINNIIQVHCVDNSGVVIGNRRISHAHHEVRNTILVPLKHYVPLTRSTIGPKIMLGELNAQSARMMMMIDVLRPLVCTR